MMQVKHTPGPWNMAESREGTIILDANSEFTVCNFEDCRNDYFNALLILAAPDLLEACEMQRRLINDMMRFVGSMALQDYALLNEAPIKADAAIAKANGEKK